jgi:hypothetical protein
MPTVLRIGPYRFFFYAGDRDGLLHIHVGRDNNKAKFWLEPVRLQHGGGFSRAKLTAYRRRLRRTGKIYWGVGTNTLTADAKAQSLTVTDDTLAVGLNDGRTISVPLAWYPRLLHGTPEERNNWRFIGEKEGIHWPDLDEDISVENLLTGKASGEGQSSFKRWLEKRTAA